MRLKFVALLTALMFIGLNVYAAVTVTVNGSNYSIPQTNERGWGAAVTSWIQAISTNTLQPSGGSFTLTADVDFGSSFGLKSSYLLSRTVNPSTSGLLRLSKTDSIGWRNNANSGNLLLGIDSSDNLTFNGTALPTAASGFFADNGFAIYDNGDATKKIAFQASGITTATTRTITMPDADVDLGGLTDSNLSASAGITRSKLATGTANRLIVNDGSGVLSDASAITANRALISSADGIPTHSTVTNTELELLSGLTGDIATDSNTLTLTNKTYSSAIISLDQLSYNSQDIATSATITALDTSKPFVRFTGSTATEIQGIDASGTNKAIVIHNASSAILTFKNQNGSATSTDRIITPSGGDLAVRPNSSTEFIYDQTQTRWVIKSGSGGGSDATESNDLTLSASGDTIAIDASVTDQVFRVQGNAAEAVLSTTPFTGTPTNLTTITLIGNSDDYPVTLTHHDASNGCVGNFSTLTLFKYQVARFRYLSSISRWVYVQ